jgi:hypothetical protein
MTLDFRVLLSLLALTSAIAFILMPTLMSTGATLGGTRRTNHDRALRDGQPRFRGGKASPYRKCL